MVSSNDIKALALIRGIGSGHARGITERAHGIMNRGVANLLRAGLIVYGSGRVAYRVTAAGNAALAAHYGV